MALRVADYRGALYLIGDAQRSRSVDEFRSVVASRLRETLGTEMALAGEVEGRRLATYVDDPPGALSATALAGFQEHAAQHPCVRAHFVDGVAGAVRVSDFLTMRQWQRLDVYQDCQRHLGGRYEIGVPFSMGDGRYACLALQRPTRDFSERERELLNTLRPHLAWGYETIRRRTEGPEVSAEVLVELLPISAREAQVLACVAQGYTNAEVAQELVISRHTVNKHLERIYDKLRVPNRTAASALAHETIGGAAGYGMRP